MRAAIENSSIIADLVDHFRQFHPEFRAALADTYGVGSSRPAALAGAIVEHPERALKILQESLSETAWELLQRLAYDHDLIVDTSASPAAHRALVELGLLAPSHPAGEGLLPCALACVIAPTLTGIRTTLPTLLPSEIDSLKRIADAHGLPTGGSRVELMVRIVEHVSTPGTLERLVEQIEDPEVLGIALTVLELGGLCFWQEAVGFDLSDNPNFGSNVVALMPSNARDFERHAARYLEDLGLLFQVIESDGTPFAVVPEELWLELWTIGRDWLLEWTQLAAQASAEGRSKRSTPAPVAIDVQSAIKWLICESKSGPLSPTNSLEPSTADRLARVASTTPERVALWIDTAGELGAFFNVNESLQSNPDFYDLVDSPKAEFQHELLCQWCTGFGRDTSVYAARALGLDERWRLAAVDMLTRHDDPVPAWMKYEGVEQEITGCGYIRNEPHHDEELHDEITLVNSALFSSRLLFLDVLSTFDNTHWIPKASIVELFQLCCANGIYSLLLNVLQNPNVRLYLPLQRPSIVGDPQQSDHFGSWLDSVLTYFETLGLARVSEDSNWVWLDTHKLRIRIPIAEMDDARQEILQQLFRDPNFEFVVHEPRARLSAVTSYSQTEGSLRRPTSELLAWLDGRRIGKLEHDTLYLEN